MVANPLEADLLLIVVLVVFANPIGVCKLCCYCWCRCYHYEILSLLRHQTGSHFFRLCLLAGRLQRRPPIINCSLRVHVDNVCSDQLETCWCLGLETDVSTYCEHRPLFQWTRNREVERMNSQSSFETKGGSCALPLNYFRSESVCLKKKKKKKIVNAHNWPVLYRAMDATLQQN